MTESGLTYRDAGVDIDAGDELVERIKPVVKRTMRREVLAGIGGFGALVEVPLDRYRKPVLVSGTDGVGTKLRLAIDTGRHDKIGIDLVAMCANDVAVSGAEPLFFLDYYATGKLKVEVAEAVIRGIAEGCELAGAALVGDAEQTGTGEPIAVFHDEGEYFALNDRCSHGEASLADGWIEGGQVECPLHSGKFCLRTGSVLSMPATEDVAAHKVEVEGDEIWLYPGQAAAE